MLLIDDEAVPTVLDMPDARRGNDVHAVPSTSRATPSPMPTSWPGTDAAAHVIVVDWLQQGHARELRRRCCGRRRMSEGHDGSASRTAQRRGQAPDQRVEITFSERGSIRGTQFFEASRVLCRLLAMEDGFVLKKYDPEIKAVRSAWSVTKEGIADSVGIVGDAYDKALMESIIGLHKAECLRAVPARAAEDRR